MNNLLKNTKNILKEIAPSILIAWLFTTFIIANTYVPTGSMENTIMTGSRLVGNRLEYLFSNPKRGDIIVFKYPDDEKIYFVKRLIGLPNDFVEIIPNGDGTGYVRVNGKILNEPYLKEEMVVDEYKSYNVPENNYFFLGDNRNNSLDARYWKNTFVKKENLVAKIYFEYFKTLKFIK
jgi:hypothetical protein